MGTSDFWFSTYFDKGGNVNKYIDMIEKKYPPDKFDPDERRRFLVAHMSNDQALKLAIYLRDRGICIFNTNYDEDIRYMRAIFETLEQREERLKREKKLQGKEDEKEKDDEEKKKEQEEKEAEALEKKKALDLKILFMKCGLAPKQKTCEKLPEPKVEKVPEVKVERVPEVKVEKVPEVK